MKSPSIFVQEIRIVDAIQFALIIKAASAKLEYV